MAYSQVGVEIWGSGYTAIPITTEYDYVRSGADMLYKFRLTLGALDNGHYYNISIHASIALDGVTVIDDKLLKDTTPSTWKNPIVWESDWITVASKTEGSTTLSLRVFAGNWQSGGRDLTYTYNLAVSPAPSDFQVGNITISKSNTIAIFRVDNTFVHSVILKFGDETIVEDNVAESADLTPPMSWCNLIPNSTTAQASLTVITKTSEQVELGSVTKTVALIVPDSIIPTVSASLEGIDLFKNLYLYSKSRVKISVNALGVYSSTIKNVIIQGAGYSYNDSQVTTGVLNVTGDVKFTVTATDSRGRTASAYYTITVLAYFKPTISVKSCFRCDSEGNPNENGNYIWGLIELSCASVNGENAISAQASYREVGDLLFTESTNIFSNVGKVLFGELSETKSYEVRFSALDTVGDTAESIVTINSSSNYILTAVPGKIALGGYVDKSKGPGVQIINELYIKGYSLLDYIKLSGIIPKPNLLHNWYFGNPVNQRGLSEYTGKQYCIDRWVVQYNTSVAVINGAIRLSGSWDISQILPQTVNCQSVFSVLSKNNTKSFLLRAYDESGSTIGTVESTASDGLVSLVLPAGVKIVSINMANKGGTVDMIAAKLELGSTQTLGHQEDDVWYLNSTPDYEVQLIQCQRYYQKRSIVLPINSAGIGWYTFPVEMRSTPSVVVTIDSDVVPQYVHSYGFAITGLPANSVLNATYEAIADL